jgi:DNA-binding SARP family transcriptional activator/tetratricopeptide (TPR) repeat protein
VVGLEFRILGPLEVREGDRLLELRGAKKKLLLGMLLLHANEVVPREALIDVIWGVDPPETARKALQNSVSQLRKLLARPSGEPVIVTRSPGYELRVEAPQLDLARFERALDEAERAGGPRAVAQGLGAALALWRGPALADVELGDALHGEVARLEELRLRATEDRIDADLALGDHAAVVPELEALVAEHPLRERLRAQLMLALYRSGRQADSLAVYRDTRRVLLDELGIDPGRELRELEGRILAQDPGLQPSQRVRAGEGLVGRQKELAALLPVVDAALAGSGAIVLLAGEPGIGKSRLAEALARDADERGAAVAVGRCWEAGGAPAYWPWAQALGAYVRDADPDAVRSALGREGADIVAIVPELADLVPAAKASHGEGGRFRQFAAIAAFLRRAASARPLALFLDDLHAADPPSLLLLRFMADEVARAPLLILGCYRDTEVGAPLAATLPELARQGSVHRVSLGGLGLDETAHLLELTTGAALPDELVERVHERCEGNPLFAVETGRLLAAGGVRGDEPLPIPAGIAEAIGRQLQATSEGCRDLLVLASIIGREFEVDALGRASGFTEAEILDELEEAEAARLVGGVPGASGRLRFSHILVRDTVYDDLPAARRMRLHRRVGEALEALHARNPDPHLAELAHHYLLAGSQSAGKAIDYATRAGHRAASLLAYEEAARHYQRALNALEATGSGDPARTCEVLLSLGEVLSRAGDEGDSKAALRRAAALAEQQGWPDQLARAALSYGGRFSWERASADPGLIPLLERALAAIGDEDARVRALLLARLAGARRDDRRRDHRVALGQQAVEIARTLDDPETLAVALEGRWNALEGPDSVDEGLALTEEIAALWEQIGDKDRLYTGHDHRLNAFWRCCDRAGVDLELDALARLAAELRQPAQRWALGTVHTMLALMEGRLDEAERLVAETAAIGQRAAAWSASVSRRMGLFVLRHEQGRLAELDETIRRSVHEYPALLRFACALAHLHGELGNAAEARATVDAILTRDLAHEHRDPEWLFSLSLLAEPCAFLSDEAAAARLHAVLLPYERLYAQAPVEAVFGCVARALGVLATTAGRFDQAEKHFTLAIETERRMRARPWLAHAKHDLAAMLRKRRAPGDVDRAGALLQSARATYHDLHMHAWAARCDELEQSSLAGRSA